MANISELFIISCTGMWHLHLCTHENFCSTWHFVTEPNKRQKSHDTVSHSSDQTAMHWDC